MASSPIAIALRAVSPKYILTIRPLFGWLLRPPIQQEPSKSEAPSPSQFLFFSRSIRCPKQWVDGLPYAFRPFESSRQRPPHRLRYVGCYVSLSNGGHPRTVFRPSLNFLMGAISAPKNKGTKRSAREPSRRAPLLGSWGAAAPRFGSMAGVSMEREGKAGGGRVSSGSSCVACVVVCASV